MSKYTAQNLAHYTVDKCTRDNEPISNLQLQKILYFLQAVYAKVTGQLLFDDEFEAWQYGPVLPDIYYEYSNYSGSDIEYEYPKSKLVFSSEDIGFIDEGIESLRKMYPWDLVKIAHAGGSPWDIIWKDGNGYKDTIPNDLIIKVHGKKE